MKSTLLTLGFCALVGTTLTGCAGHVYVRDSYPPPPVVVQNGGPVVVDVVDIDYWYDGARYYYRDTSVGLYFYWSSGTRVWCDRGWNPNHGWHRHDRLYRNYDPHWRSYPPVHRGPVYQPPVHRPPVYRNPPRQPDHGFPGRGRDNDGRGGRGNDGRGNDHGGRGNDHGGRGNDHGGRR
jgi:hypothetical protein